MEKRNVYEIFVNQSKRGNGYASWKLAMMHMTGRGCERSVKRAVQYLQTAANQNSPLGRRDLAKAVLAGLSDALSRDEVYDELLTVMSQGVTSLATWSVVMESGRPQVERAALKILKAHRFERCAFDVRMLLAVTEVTKSGIPFSRAEIYSQLQEISHGDTEPDSTIATRALWLSDPVAYFFPKVDLSNTVKALMHMPDADSKIDAFELAHSMPNSTPELRLETSKALSVAVLQGSVHAKLISLCVSLRESDEAGRKVLIDQLISIVLANPELFNDHVENVFSRLILISPDFAPLFAGVLEKIKGSGQPAVRTALARTLLVLGRKEEALEIIKGLIGTGHCELFRECASVHLELFKQGKVDSETALFWAEAWQQDDINGGLAAVTAVYEAMGPQSSEQKLAQYQVLEERAGHGDPVACTDLALLLLEGKGVCISNSQRAFRLLEKATEREYARAMYHFGLCHLRGIGTHTDEDMGHYWISQAAAHGFTRSKLTPEKKTEKNEAQDSIGGRKDGQQDEGETDEENWGQIAPDSKESTSKAEQLRDVAQKVVELAKRRKKTARQTKVAAEKVISEKTGA